MEDFFRKEIVLANTHVRLVPFSGFYKEGLRKIIFDEEVTRYTGDHRRDDNDLDNYMERTLAGRHANSHYPFIVIDQATGEVAGATSFGNLAFHNKRLEIGWTWYGEAYRGTHINKAAKYELLKYAFEQMNVNRVQFSVDADNIRSQKAVLKLGAKLEGIFRCNYENASGQCRDDLYYSIIKPEWPELKRTVFREFSTAIYIDDTY